MRKHGLREPISLFEQRIIDGRNRERACIKAGVEPRYRSIEFDNHDAAAAYVISKNIRRRHLAPKQKRELIEKLLRADPTQSDRQIARAVKVDNKAVGAVRTRAEAREEIPHVSKRTDSKGRSQVAHKRNSANKGTKSTIDLTDQCIEGVRERIERTVTDLRRTGATTFERLFVALVKVIEDTSFVSQRRCAASRTAKRKPGLCEGLPVTPSTEENIRLTDSRAALLGIAEKSVRPHGSTMRSQIDRISHSRHDRRDSPSFVSKEIFVSKENV
jgi:ParB-like chromosome segregation protein Spo0J